MQCLLFRGTSVSFFNALVFSILPRISISMSWCISIQLTGIIGFKNWLATTRSTTKSTSSYKLILRAVLHRDLYFLLNYFLTLFSSLLLSSFFSSNGEKGRGTFRIQNVVINSLNAYYSRIKSRIIYWKR